MAKRDLTSERTISKAQRLLKIGYVGSRRFTHRNCLTTCYTCNPSLRLNGNRLAEAGFSTDTPVKQGRLVIEPFKS